MRILLLLLFVLPLAATAQAPLSFNKRFVESEDQWVAFPMNKDSQYSYGFIYIDEMAGLTFHYAGDFRIGPDGSFVAGKPLLDGKTGSLKVRLEPNRVLVAHLPMERLRELKQPPVPEWLHVYKSDTASVKRLHRWGYFYNHWNEPARALGYLERGYALDPAYNGMAFELAFSYNALGQYSKALPVLGAALAADPKNCLLYKELSYAEMHLGQLEAAAATCRKGIPLCTDTGVKAELAYNVAYEYFKARNKAGFDSWAAEARKWAPAGGLILQYLGQMEKRGFE